MDTSDLTRGAAAGGSSAEGGAHTAAGGFRTSTSGSAGSADAGTSGTNTGGSGFGSGAAGESSFAGVGGAFGGLAGTQGVSGGAGTSSAGAGGTGSVGVYWTGWMNRDNPAGFGDSEQRTLFGTVCEHPIDFEARVAKTNVAYFETGERLIASTTFGIECRNIDQPDEACEDYEINFLCPEKWPVPGTWSNWASKDTPTGLSDNEQLSGWISPPCVMPWAIEATTLSGTDYTLTGDFVRIEPDFGLLCQNSLQPDGACSDYRVRFFCAE